MNRTNTYSTKFAIYLILIMVSIFIFIILSLYNHNLQHRKNHLKDIIKGEVLIIESLLESNLSGSSILQEDISKQEIEEFIVQQLFQIHSKSNYFDKTGEIVLAKKNDNEVEFLLENRFLNKNKFQNKKESFAEPMIRALNGNSGIIIAKDYRGEEVLAAFESISKLNIGLVAKIDMKEIREPFIIIGLLAFLFSLVIIFIGFHIYAMIKNPTLELLKIKENKYRGIFDCASDMLFLLDTQHLIIEVNRSARKKYKFEGTQLVGKDFKEIIFSKYHKQFKNTLASTFRKIDVKILSRHITSLGDTFPVEVHISPISLENDNVLLVSVRDISRRVEDQNKNIKLEAKLSQAEKLASIGQLAAGVAHEINNPMGFIHSNLNTMNKYLWKIKKHFTELELQNSSASVDIDEIIEDFGDAISESLDGSDRVKKIVSDLKSFARSDNKFDYVDINQGIISTLNIVHNQLKYHCEIQEDLQEIPNVYCISGNINQVVMNLLVNAGQAIEKEGIIKIKTWIDDINVFISIKDNGIGIPEDKLSQIYDPFYTSKEVGVGTGLGLSVVFDIIRKHNGTIDVTSEVGVGTEFIVKFPHKCNTIQKQKIDTKITEVPLINPYI